MDESGQHTTHGRLLSFQPGSCLPSLLALVAASGDLRCIIQVYLLRFEEKNLGHSDLEDFERNEAQN